jgi:hypothetical protein
MLDSIDITKLLTYDDESTGYSLEDMIVFQQEKKLLSHFLGEFILKEFKKTNPKNQQFWVSDIPRLKFIVRQAINQNETIWQPDKKGICLTRYIITPMLEEIKSLLQDYTKICELRLKKCNMIQCEQINQQSTNAVSVIYEINQKILHEKVLKYIAPYFQLELT